jgi:hypothetical protein
VPTALEGRQRLPSGEQEASAPLLQKKTESIPAKAVIRAAAWSRTGSAAAAE